ncbi:hypothetical protein GTCCBUS3UF5_8730 [Geobacillus thermoleovorans CCB_US3_UF5]|uniref:Transposase n=1 Tax=Geobacillus thermoleovorans CCB_US3_UF5 TaxID=1111068 RepID=A0ABN3ZTQ3_GEOTH|nr:hypothetical protein GTCCBUS3UF5_8730 [Geobacillus thermoleovorans CCB_US3_UF5]
MSPIFDSIDQLISSVLLYRKEERQRCDVHHISLVVHFFSFV